MGVISVVMWREEERKWWQEFVHPRVKKGRHRRPSLLHLLSFQKFREEGKGVASPHHEKRGRPPVNFDDDDNLVHPKKGVSVPSRTDYQLFYFTAYDYFIFQRL
jgi:hypothetical protein